VREVKPKSYYWFEVPARTWQLMFRSTDTKGRAVASVSTVMVPFKAPSEPSERVLLSYQAAYDGLTLSCAPSYAIIKGAQWEQVLINRALKRGWIVSVPDYEGLQSLWGDAVNSGQGVLDGVRAALSFGPLGLSGLQTRVGLVGYSGGALASAWAAELAPSYAPELPLAGVAAGGVPVDIGNIGRKVDGGFFSGLYVTMSVALARANPEVKPEAVLNDRGMKAYAKAQEMCAGQFMTGVPESVTSFPFKHMADFTKVPDFLAHPEVKRVIEANRLGQRVPKVPLYIYQGTIDQVMPIDDVDQLVQGYCKAGAKVQYARSFNDHLILPLTGFGGALDFLAERFAGKPFTKACPGG
jgi:pimeloyl-ACP methyl ester carboxylesterase